MNWKKRLKLSTPSNLVLRDILSELREKTVKRLRPYYAELGIILCGVFPDGSLVVGLPMDATDEELARVEEMVREIVGNDVTIRVVRVRFVEDV